MEKSSVWGACPPIMAKQGRQAKTNELQRLKWKRQAMVFKSMAQERGFIKLQLLLEHD